MKARWWGDPSEQVVVITCLGCNEEHHLYVGPERGSRRPGWGFNNNFTSPTFTPSLLVRTGKYVGSSEWYNKQTPEEKEFTDRHSNICHSFITEGRMQYLNDCTHALASQTVELPDAYTQD